MQNLRASASRCLSVWGRVYRRKNQSCCSCNIWLDGPCIQNEPSAASQFKLHTANPQRFLCTLWFGKGQQAFSRVRVIASGGGPNLEQTSTNSKISAMCSPPLKHKHRSCVAELDHARQHTVDVLDFTSGLQRESRLNDVKLFFKLNANVSWPTCTLWAQHNRWLLNLGKVEQLYQQNKTDSFTHTTASWENRVFFFSMVDNIQVPEYYMKTLLKQSQTAVCELTSIFGAEVQEVMDGIHHLLLLSLQGRAVSCGPAQLGFQLPDHPALTPHQSLETSLLLLQRLQLFPVSHLHF